MQSKIKILCYTDSIYANTGFAQVARNILLNLEKTGDFEITQFGVNHIIERDNFGREINKNKYPIDVIDAMFLNKADYDKGLQLDQLGKRKLWEYMCQNDFDIFFTVFDTKILHDLPEMFEKLRKGSRKFKTIVYFPIDHQIFPKAWIEILNKFDVAVPYTQFGIDSIQATLSATALASNNPDDVVYRFEQPIYHGANCTEYYPLQNGIKKKLKKKFKVEDKFVCLNVNRNQPRKDPVRSLAVFAQFKKKVSNSIYYFLCDSTESAFDLRAECLYFGLKPDQDVIFPDHRLTNAEVNEWYNLADVCFSTTLGEGFGLSIIEAMATKCPLVFPANTACVELIGEHEERGYLSDCGSIDCWTVTPFWHGEPPRPTTMIEPMVAKLYQVYADKEKKKQHLTTMTDRKIANAYAWAKEHQWERIVYDYWLKYFK